MATATFRPQAWIRDNAIPVDPQGPTTWEVSPEHLAELVADFGLAKLMESGYEADELRNDPAAPEWIREWQGPFDVSLDGDYPMAAPPMIVDAYGNLWPADYIVCQKCGQPDNCGDCTHGRLTADDVRELGGTPA